MLIHKAGNIKLIPGVISRQIKDYFQPVTVNKKYKIDTNIYKCKVVENSSHIGSIFQSNQLSTLEDKSMIRQVLKINNNNNNKNTHYVHHPRIHDFMHLDKTHKIITNPMQQYFPNKKNTPLLNAFQLKQPQSSIQITKITQNPQIDPFVSQFSMQYREHVEPRILWQSRKALKIENMNISHCKQEQRKCSISTTSTSRPHSAQKLHHNSRESQQHNNLIDHLKDLSTKTSGYKIKWKVPTSTVTKNMRVILGEWLYQLAHELQMPVDTVYNAMHYTDKYVGLVAVTRNNYQSIGLCALFIASKLQLSNHPNIVTFIESALGSVTKQSLLGLELDMVKKLKFRLNPPTLHQYMVLLVSLYNNFAKQDNMVNLSLKLLEIPIQSHAYTDLFWILDGIHLENPYNYSNKQKICISVLYLILKKYNTTNLRKLQPNIQTFKLYGEIQQKYDTFLNEVGLNWKKLQQIKQYIIFYKKWLKYDRSAQLSYDLQIEQLKNIVTNQ